VAPSKSFASSALEVVRTLREKVFLVVVERQDSRLGFLRARKPAFAPHRG
jgi:hypothetical protein